MSTNEDPKRPPTPVGVAPAEEAFWIDPERRRRLEDLARQLSGDRPRSRMLERLRVILRRRRGGSW